MVADFSRPPYRTSSKRKKKRQPHWLALFTKKRGGKLFLTVKQF
jgi:hypothetical protein